jgi:hypothetical protein
LDLGFSRKSRRFRNTYVVHVRLPQLLLRVSIHSSKLFGPPFIVLDQRADRAPSRPAMPAVMDLF